MSFLPKNTELIKQHKKLLLSLQNIDIGLFEIHSKKEPILTAMKSSKDKMMDIEDDSRRDNEEIAKTKIELERLREELVKFEKDKQVIEDNLLSASNSEEEEALKRDLDYCRLEIKLSIKKIRDVNNLHANLKRDIHKRDQDSKLQQEIFYDEHEKLQKLDEKISKEEESLQMERDELTKKLDPAILQEYEKISSCNMPFIAAGSIRDDVCTGCNILVTPIMQVQVHEAEDWVFCDHCGAFMLFVEKTKDKIERFPKG